MKIDTEERHGKENQFHMFPSGFVDRKKEANEGLISGPFIDKMSKGTYNQYKNSSGNAVVFQMFHDSTSIVILHIVYAEG